MNDLFTVADINWNSTVQVASVLYGKKGKPVYKEKGEKLPNTYEVIEYTFTGESFVRGELTHVKRLHSLRMNTLLRITISMV